MKEIELFYLVPYKQEILGKCVCDKPGPAEVLGKQAWKRKVII